MQYYIQSIKKNIFLFIMTLMILFLTFGFWCGVPLFGLTIFFYEMSLPFFIQFVLICLSIGFCFSLFCIPLHVSFAKEYALNKQKHMLIIFLKAQSILIIIVAIIFAIFYLLTIFEASWTEWFCFQADFTLCIV